MAETIHTPEQASRREWVGLGVLSIACREISRRVFKQQQRIADSFKQLVFGSLSFKAMGLQMPSF
jgi:hypothetical protein